MTPEEKRDYNRAYYIRNREKRLEQVKAYRREFYNKGLRKPHLYLPRSIRDHERYMEKRDEIREKQRAYYQTHRDYYKEKSRKWYLKKREEHIKELWKKKNSITFRQYGLLKKYAGTRCGLTC